MKRLFICLSLFFISINSNSKANEASIYSLDEIRKMICIDSLLFGIKDACLESALFNEDERTKIRDELKSASQFTDADKAEIVNALSEIIGGLKPHLFNEMILEIGTKFERSPSHRQFVGNLLFLISEKIKHEIELDLDRVLIKPMLVDAALVLLVGSIGSAGKGLLIGGSWHTLQKAHALFYGQPPVQGLRAFKEILKLIFASLSKDKKIILWGGAAAAAYGSIDVVLARVDEKKMDPMIILRASSKAAILRLWQWLMDRREEILALEGALIASDKLSLEEAESFFKSCHKKLSEIESSIRNRDVKDQIMYLYEQAQENRFQLETMAQDFEGLRLLLKKRGEQLTGFELRRASMEEAPSQQTEDTNH